MSFDSPYSSQMLDEIELLDDTYCEEDLSHIDSIESAYFEKEWNDRTETQCQSLEKNTGHKNRNHSDMITSVRTGNFSTKHVETDADTESAFVEEFTSTNDDETTIRVGRAKEIDTSNEQSLQTESTKCAEKETRKRKLNADTSAEPDEGSKSRKYTATSMGNIERNVSCSLVQQDMNTTMQDIPNTSKSKLIDVQTNDYMTSTSLTSESSIGHPLKKSQDDTLSESMLESLSGKMKSVGILIANKNVGTVFRVGSKYLMTALHVVKGLVMDDSVYVTFHENALTHQKKVYHIEKVIFFNQDLDVAVLELASLDSTLPPKMQLSKDVDILNVKEVSLIGYGHPGKSYIKHLDPRCKLISAQSHRFLEAHTWLDQNITYIKNAVSKMGQDPAIVDKGYGCYADNNKIIFDCFMQQGASGSPALTYNNYGQVKVAGILTHGLPEFYFLMPELTRHLVDSNHRFEVASKMSSIYSSILNENEDLANDLFE